MLEGLLGYAANGLIGAAGGAMVRLHRGASHYDEERKVNVSDGDGLSARIISLFPQYRHFSAAVDHFGRGVFIPYATGGAVGFLNLLLANTLGANSQQHSEILFNIFLNPDFVYPVAWLASSSLIIAYEILNNHFLTRRKMDFSDFAQYTTDAASILVSGHLILGGYRL